MTLIARAALLLLLWPLMPTPTLGQETCGFVRPPQIVADPYYLRGRDHAIVYVPESLPASEFNPDLADLVCLLQKANDRWQNGCPNSRIPKLQVVQGERPAGDHPILQLESCRTL